MTTDNNFLLLLLLLLLLVTRGGGGGCTCPVTTVTSSVNQQVRGRGAGMSGSGGGSGSWKQQLHLAEKQYSDFFPDLELPSAQTQGDRDGGSLSQSQGASDPVDTSTLFNEDAFMTTILTLGIVALDKEELEAKNEEDTKLEASRRYSKTTINEMDAIDEIEGSLEQLISSIDRYIMRQVRGLCLNSVACAESKLCC